jgi:ribosomal protein S19E (S16A)
MDGKSPALNLDDWTALRRISQGIRNPKAFGVGQVARLQKLGLITQTRVGLTLSDEGRSYLESRAKTTPSAPL